MKLAAGERIATIIQRACWVGIMAHAAFIPLFAWLGYRELAVFNVASTAVWGAASILNARGHSTTSMWLIVAEVMAHGSMAVIFLGSGTGFEYYLIPLIPFVMFNERLSTRVIVISSFAIVANCMLLMAFGEGTTLAREILRPIQIINVGIPMLVLGLVSYNFRLVSISVERRLRSAAQTDVLTELPNRRRIAERLREEKARTERTKAVFSVVLADIDNFKRINDTYGHDIGDSVLVATARCLRKSLRDCDLVGRWGGEEFVMVLPETKLSDAGLAIERLRVAVAKGLSAVPGCDNPVTLTFGIAPFVDGASIDECLRSADDAMYRGKASGRNCVVLAAT
tara:strand:+ start:18495 stop:19514 length:1020 start_codon:yes stop_codon:yes gene_type:complete